MKPHLTMPLLLASALVLPGCGGSSTDSVTAAENSTAIATVTDSVNPTSSTDTNTSPVTNVANTQTLTVAETTTLLYVREEEKLARDVYLTLYNRWGQKVFQTIATTSEQTHMDAIKTQLDLYGLNDPVMSDIVGAFTDSSLGTLYTQLTQQGSTSLTEGLKVGAFIEEYDIQDLQEAINEAQQGSQPATVIRTYTNLMCGSRNHLRAFVRQLEMNGVVYAAQLLSQANVNLIVDSTNEQCDQP